MKVGVIDYGVGNLGSVLRALEELRVTPVLVNDVDSPAALAIPKSASLTALSRLSAANSTKMFAGLTSR